VLKLLVKTLVALLLAAAALVAYAVLGHRPEPFPDASVSIARLAPGPFEVDLYEEVFVDPDRPTQAHGDYAGADRRSLPTSVWYPRGGEGGAAPLLLFSHGFTSFRHNGRYLGEHLASHGYVVAAADFPLTSMWAPGGALVEDLLNQPGDLSFLIDRLSAYSRVAGHPLSGRIDASRVGVFGISLGGLTSTLAGLHPELRDPRIGAALSIAGPTYFFTGEFFDAVDLPFMMLAGEFDALVPWESNAAPLAAKDPDAWLVTVLRGSHTGFSDGSSWLRMMKNTDAVGCWSVQRFVDEDDGDDWAGLLGDPGDGIDYAAESELCRVDPLPRAVNVLRQQMIAKVAVRAFFDSVFSADGQERAAARRYLATTLPRELDDVTVRGGPGP
jgi:dienelactone hydrolase